MLCRILNLKHVHILVFFVIISCFFHGPLLLTQQIITSNPLDSTKFMINLIV